ncbi:sulfotransferase domain-containing protein [Amycolatopsis sp. NPDC021455]|uniref:sulfotransferase domain-containing protein n=1 Tax=Amycolatopsis sp. NPDC021455 TaxID=3154901 RepID=UPI0033E7DEC5
MRDDDIVMPSIGGAGSSLLGNVILELGLHYVDLTKETLRPDGSSRPPTDEITRRIRAGRFAEAPERPTAPRFMKTHLPAGEFENHAIGGVWMLVRDPRDALYSWYQYHRGFARLPWEQVPGTFEEFLAKPFFIGVPPVAAWTSYYREWAGRGRGCAHFTTLRFEDLKRRPVTTMREALEPLGLSYSTGQLGRATERSSFTAMRRHEDSVAATGGSARVMRSGAVDGWRSWMTPELEPFFTGSDFTALAQSFGYDL